MAARKKTTAKKAPAKPKTPPKRKPGRPRKYTSALGDSICKRIAAGETLINILKDAGMPNRDTVWRWQKEIPEFSDLYAQARYDQTRTWADETVTIADDIQQDYLRDAKGNPVLHPKTGDPIFVKESPQRTQQRIGARQWLIERINREEYGARQTVDVNHNFDNKDDAELLHELRVAAERAGITPEDLAALMSGAVALN